MKTSLLTLISVSLIAVSCGKKDDAEKSQSASDFANDSEQTMAVAGSNMEDAYHAVSDQAASSSLSLFADATNNSTYSRSCAVKDSKAVVDIKNTIDRSLSISRLAGRLVSTRTITGSDTINRSWSRSSAMECTADGKFAKINWSDVVGLKLDATYSRSREFKYSLVDNRKSKTYSRSASYSGSGTRSVSWDSSTTGSTTSSIVRKKTITFSGTKNLKVIGNDGSERSLSLEISSKDGAPLVVNTERSATDYSLLSQTIVSGTVVSKKADSHARVESSFENFKVTFTSADGKCSINSGSKKTVIYEEGSTTVLASFTLTAVNGEITVVDASGAEVDSFEAPDCDPADFRN